MTNTPLGRESDAYWSGRVYTAIREGLSENGPLDQCRLLGRGVINGYAIIHSPLMIHSYMALFPGETERMDWLEFGSFHADYPYDRKRLGLLALQAQPNMWSKMYGGPNNHTPSGATRRELFRAELPLAIALFYGTQARSNAVDEFGGLVFPASLGPWQALKMFEDPVIERLRELNDAEALDFDEV